MWLAGGSTSGLLSFFAEPFVTIVRHWDVLRLTTLVDIRSAYAGSVMGIAWVVIGPLLMLSIYAMVYVVIFRVRPTGMTVNEYVLYVFCGLVPFLAFANSLTAGALSLSTNRAVLLNTVFPAELIPIRAVLVASASMPAGILILFFGDILFSKPSPMFFLVFAVMILQLMFTAGVCWMLSLLALLVRDIQQLLYYVTMVLLIFTPIAYTPDMIPAQLKFVMYLNPLFYYVVGFQYLIILDKLPPLHICLIGVVNSFVVFAVGYRVCSRAKQVFYDYA